MSAVAEETDLISIIQQASPQSRRVALESLIGGYMEDTKFLPHPIRDASGEVVGLFVPQYQNKSPVLPKFTKAEWDEINRRYDTPEDSVTPEEFIKLLGQEDARLRSQQ